MRGSILIVEDFSDWRDLLRGLLAREGHEVTAVATIEEAREYLATATNLDLAILDIRLVEADEKNEDGMRLLAEIDAAGQPAGQSFTRVIMITGHGTMETQRRAFRQFRAFDFFRKEEFDSETFRESVQEAVEAAAQARRAAKNQDYIRGHRYEMWQRDQRG